MAIKPFNSVGGFSVGETPSNVILANGDITTTNVTVSGKSNLNSLANVYISGGSFGQVIQTDGNGNLSFTTLSSNSLTNGNSNIQVLNNSNITFSSTGTSNVFVITGTGANVNGNLDVTGNITGSNISGNISGNISAAGYSTGVMFNDSGLLNSTSGLTFDKTSNSLIATGNITGNNVISIGNIQVSNWIITVGAGNDLILGPSTLTTRSYGNLNPYTGGFDLGTSGTPWNNIYGNTVNVSANLNAGNVNSSGFLSVTGNANVGNLNSLGSLTVTGNANVGNIGANNASFSGTGSFGGNLNMSSFNINNLATPTNPSDAATKAYVDGLAQGLNVKTSSKYATTSSLPSYTYNNGASGVGATITANSNGALSIDSNTPNVNDRVLIKDETGANLPYNGIYVVTQVGDGSNPFILTRATDMDQSSEVAGAYTFIQSGTVNGYTGWICNTTNPVVIGTTNITFVQFSSAAQYSAGTGLNLNGSVFSIANTTVSPNTYGGSDTVGVFTVNQQGQLTYAANTPINANAANLTGTTLSSNVIYSNLTTLGTLAQLSVSGNANVANLNASNNVTANANVIGGNLVTTGYVSTPLIINGTSNIAIANNSNISISIGGTSNVFVASSTGINITGTANISSSLILGNTTVSWATVVTNAVTANQTIASVPVTGMTGIEFIVKGVDSTGLKYSVATVQAVTDGSNVDYSTFGTVNLGGYTGSLVVNVVGGFVRLQVTPSSSNNTTWTTQYRFI